MKFLFAISFHLHHTRELFPPLLEALRNEDRSALFLSVAPGLAEQIHRQIRDTLRRVIAAGWLVGRRGGITKTLIDALGNLQRGRSAATADRALIHLSAAFGQLGEATAALALLAAGRPV
jgi:hypothetical protein